MLLRPSVQLSHAIRAGEPRPDESLSEAHAMLCGPTVEQFANLIFRNT